MHRCDQGLENSVTRLASVRCPGGLAFDIDRQTCDWKTNVKNCDQIESKFRGIQEVVLRRACFRVEPVCLVLVKLDNRLTFRMAASCVCTDI